MIGSTKMRVRLAELEKAHAGTPARYSPSVEDYLEMIYELIEQKGYARTVDIASHLHVSPPSTTKMIQHLHDKGFLEYERYRGITMTETGTKIARAVKEKHELIARFLRILGVDYQTAHIDAEGIEHHVHPKTVDRITKFVRFVQENPQWFSRFTSPVL